MVQGEYPAPSLRIASELFAVRRQITDTGHLHGSNQRCQNRHHSTQDISIGGLYTGSHLRPEIVLQQQGEAETARSLKDGPTTRKPPYNWYVRRLANTQIDVGMRRPGGPQYDEMALRLPKPKQLSALSRLRLAEQCFLKRDKFIGGT